MKKSISANIAGTLFQIDEDAYSLLEQYLRKISGGFKNPADGKEIVTDLELRMSELFNERTNQRSRNITLEDANWVIGVLGKPEDLGATQTTTNSDWGPGNPYYRPPHKLYRDPDHKVLGGVCSGLGAYFDVDPVIMRVLFVVFFFVGFGFLAYIVLWIAVPKAYTVTQKLEMRGEPPTPENMKKYSNTYF
jgi:phage shock protein PspC (stress-responsive transcriptional regulator)